MMRRAWMVALAVVGLLAAPGAGAVEPMRALIVDGQNNHGNWPTTTKMMTSSPMHRRGQIPPFARTSPGTPWS